MVALAIHIVFFCRLSTRHLGPPWPSRHARPYAYPADLIRPAWWSGATAARQAFLQSRFVYLFLLFIKFQQNILTPEERAENEIPDDATFLDRVIRDVLPRLC